LPAVSEAALNCEVVSSCAGGTVIFRMDNTINSHAELWDESNFFQLVCA